MSPPVLWLLIIQTTANCKTDMVLSRFIVVCLLGHNSYRQNIAKQFSSSSSCPMLRHMTTRHMTEQWTWFGAAINCLSISFDITCYLLTGAGHCPYPGCRVQGGPSAAPWQDDDALATLRSALQPLAIQKCKLRDRGWCGLVETQNCIHIITEGPWS